MTKKITPTKPAKPVEQTFKIRVTQTIVNEFDVISTDEDLAQERAIELFNCEKNLDIDTIAEVLPLTEPTDKPFLVDATVTNGEHEHRTHAMVRAVDIKAAQKQANALCRGRKAYFGHGDGQTESSIDDVKEITEQQADTLRELNLVHYA